MDNMTPDEFRSIREALGYNVTQFARLLGVPRRTAQRWESGHSSIAHSLKMLLRLMERDDILSYVEAQQNGSTPPPGSKAAETLKLNRARKQWMIDGDVTRDQLIHLFRECNGKCQYCGGDVACRFDPISPHGFDHVTPHSRGGKHTITNLVVCCRRCNLRKGPRSHSRDNWS